MTTQTRTVMYGERWNGHLGRLGRTIDEADARQRHETGKLYTALLGDPEQPHAVVEVRLEADFVAVRFLDGEQRTYLDYVFARPKEGGEDGMLFLRQATERRFDDSGNVVWGGVHVFEPSGLVQVEEKDYVRSELERYKTENDVSANWEPVPEFGRYESIARVERDRPPAGVDGV